jgi:hypothetical protein
MFTRFGPFALQMEELLGSNPSVGRTLIDDQCIRQGPHVVLDLVAKAGMIERSHVYFDNLFTSLSFAVVAVRGTVCQDRLNKVATKEEKELEKKAVPRGTADVLYQADQVLVVRKDNKAVYMA